MNRREALRRIGTAAVAVPLAGRVGPVGTADVVPAEHLPTLRVLGHVVLPQELGSRGIERVVEDFLGWLRGYREGAEMDHGYGVPRVSRTGPSPAGRYPAQLATLEREARTRGAACTELDGEARKTIVAAAIEAAGVKELPVRPDGVHVATDLMSHYFRSADANDLCYQAEIGREQCRSLEGSGERPARKER